MSGGGNELHEPSSPGQSARHLECADLSAFFYLAERQSGDKSPHSKKESRHSQ